MAALSAADEGSQRRRSSIVTSSPYAPPADDSGRRGDFSAAASNAPAETAPTPDSDALESPLEELLEIEKFPPPEDFRKQALRNDPAVYDEAESDWQGWCS